MLRLEMGMHTAEIEKISVDAAGRMLLTASTDKTARLWDLATGRILHVLRPPLGEGNEGKLYACALSPDGRLAALGGHTGYQWEQSCSIYLFDAPTGQYLRRIPGLPAHSIDHLAFSRDGSRLVACLGRSEGDREQSLPGSGGIQVFGLAPDRELFRDLDYGGPSHSADFDAMGRLATTSYDGLVRLYAPEGSLLAKVRSPVGARPRGIRFSPDGSVLAVGHDDQARVYVFSVPYLKPLFSPGKADVGGNLRCVAWSLDGKTLYAGGRYNPAAAAGRKPRNTQDRQISHQQGNIGFMHDRRKGMIRSWSDGGHGSSTDTATEAEVSIGELAVLPSGDLLWASGDPAWGRVGEAFHRGANGDFRDMDLKLDPSANRVSFCYEFQGKPFSFEIAGRNLGRGEGSGLDSPRTQGLPIRWDWTFAPTLGSQALKVDAGERSRSLAIVPDGSRFLLGTSGALRCFDAHGNPLWARTGPEAAYAVNLSGDGTLGVAAYGDGTIRWYRMADGRELLAFFPHADRKRWVLWTPSGYYDCSLGAEDLLGWHLNQGKDDAADFFPFSRFRSTYYRPDVIDRILELKDEAEALRSANVARGRQLTDEANALQLAAEARARRFAEEARARQVADEAKARQLADEARASQLADEAKARQLAEKAKAERLANAARAEKLAEEAKALKLAAEAKARQLAEEAKAVKLANEAKARQLAEEARASQLAEEARARELLEEAKAVALAKAASLEQVLPPVVAILKPTHGESITAQILTVQVRVHHPKDKPVDEVWATVDGRVPSARGIQVKESLTGTGAGRMVTLQVPVPARDCTVSVLARSGPAVSEPSSVSLKWAGAGRTEAMGALNVLAVGVSRYRDAALNLDFAAKDARDLDARMQAQKGRLYATVRSRMLLDADATKEAIQDALKWLGQATTERDTAVIFLAGHGLNDPRNQFFFLPHGADLARVADTMLADTDIQSALAAIPGRVVVFLDSCHSGAVLKRNSNVTRFVNELGCAENGVVVFTASTGMQLSQESPVWNNGAFTKALTEGLDGQADLLKKGRVTVSSLDAYLSDRVPTLTNGQQTPTVIKPAAVPDFPMALTR
jgi:hypothetical protein